MNAQAILDQVAILQPHGLATATLVTWLNVFQNELYRAVDYPSAVYNFATVMNQPKYTLPSTIVPDRIRYVYYVDSSGEETEYEFTKSYSPGTSKYTITTDNTMKVGTVPTVAGGIIASITVTNGGTSFTSAPTVTFTGGGGSGATATATVEDEEVKAVAVTAAGKAFTSEPAIGFSGGGGSGAAAFATLGEILRVHYVGKPTAITADALTAEPWGPSDYHHYYIHKLASYVAGTQKDVVMKNNFEMEAASVLQLMKTTYNTDPSSGFQMQTNW